MTITGPVLPPLDDGRSAMSRIVDRMREFLGVGGPRSELPYGQLGPSYGGGGYWLGDGRPGWSASRPVVTEASAMGLPAYGRGVELIASTLAGVELRAYRYDAVQAIDVRIDPAPEVLRDPVPISDPWQWKFGVAEDLVNFGNSFAALGDPNAEGWPRWLVPIAADTVELATDKVSGLIFWRVGGPRGRIYPFGELLHISAGNRSGKILGRSKMLQFADSISGQLSTDRHARRYFQAGGLPSAILKVNDPGLTPEQAQAYKDRYRETIGANGGEPMVVPPSVEYTPVISDAEKQQLIAARQWDAQLAGMILGIPSSSLGLPGPSMTYSNIESADIGFVRDTVDRWAKPIEAAVTKWLLPRGQTARFDWSGRMRTDSGQRANVLKTEIDAGLLVVNEGRQMLNRPPLPDKPAATPDPLVQDPTTTTVTQQNPTPEVVA